MNMDRNEYALACSAARIARELTIIIAATRWLDRTPRPEFAMGLQAATGALLVALLNAPIGQIQSA
jgi:hypothetical protein